MTPKLYTPEEIDTLTRAALVGPKPSLSAAANGFGNYDGKKSLPDGLVVFGHQYAGPRLVRACRKLGVQYLRRLAGFSHSGSKRHGYYHPHFSGVVVSASDAIRLRDYMEPAVQEKRLAATLAVYDRDEPDLEN